MVLDNDSWLIEVGDHVIQKKTSEGTESLSEIEMAIYCFWVLDYSVRNSGSLEEIEDIYPQAVNQLIDIFQKNKWRSSTFLALAELDRNAFCRNYYAEFDQICNELRAAY